MEVVEGGLPVQVHQIDRFFGRFYSRRSRHRVDRFFGRFYSRRNRRTPLPTTRLCLHNRRPRNFFSQFSAYIRRLNCLVDEISYPTTRRRAIRSRRTSFVSFIMPDTPFQRKHDQSESFRGNQRDGAQPGNSIHIQRIHDRPESSRGNQRVGDNEEISSQRERVDDLDENCPLRQWIRNIRVAAQLENSRLILRISDQQGTSGGNRSVENRDTNYLHGIGERVDDLDENRIPGQEQSLLQSQRVEIRRGENSARRKRARSKLTNEQRAVIRDIDTSRRKRARANQTTEQRSLCRDIDTSRPHRLERKKRKVMEAESKKRMWEEEEDMRPKFFKIIHSNLNTTQHLRIPPNFVKHISTEPSGRATLEGPTGSLWSVRLCVSEDGTFLQNGWQDFLKDHSLGNFEVLVFRYDGNRHFNVQIYDTTRCEKQYGFQEPAISSGRTKQGRPPKKLVGSSCKRQGRPPICQMVQSKARITDPGTEAVSLESNNTEDIGSSMCNRSSPSRTLPTEKENAKVWKDPLSFTSNFPYFMKCLTKSSFQPTFVLHIPRKFTKAYLPRCKSQFVVKDWRGTAWILNYTCGATAAFCGGLSAFVKGHLLKEGDICIFELKGELEMRVHIFPICPTS
ncbi:hypothetical protein IFM89_002492 [Coptis chinensis]|uniref:TF-B3 domain-containing protein n=1 Tax=Coptis chinensis TaxID=261450 RepID=A0A835HKI6_9MAGN|nr:hypothetical protein IFM89_002492 [Coptis chinensis]